MDHIATQGGTVFQNYVQTRDGNALREQLNDSIQRLYNKALSHRDKIEKLQQEAKMAAVRTECAVGGEILHRGPYSPSLMDIVVGGIKRGRILKRVSSASKITYRFGFDENNTLLYVEVFNPERNNLLISTEYLIRSDDTVLGVAINDEGELTTISEERYENGLLASYCLAVIFYRYGQPYCFQYITENYSYDDQGLCYSDMILYNLSIKMVENMTRCEFERADGFLSFCSEDNFRCGPGRYKVNIKRSAKWQPPSQITRQ